MKTLINTAVLAVALTVSSVAFSAAHKMEMSPSDHISHQVMMVVDMEMFGQINGLVVSTSEDGVVTLAGTANEATFSDRLEFEVMQIEGVTNVINLITAM